MKSQEKSIKDSCITKFNNEFSWKRFWHILKWEWLESKKTVVLPLLIMFVIVCIIAMGLAKIDYRMLNEFRFFPHIYVPLFPFLILGPLSTLIILTSNSIDSSKSKILYYKQFESKAKAKPNIYFNDLNLKTFEGFLVKIVLIMFINLVMAVSLWVLMYIAFFGKDLFYNNMHYFIKVPIFIITLSFFTLFFQMYMGKYTSKKFRVFKSILCLTVIGLEFSLFPLGNFDNCPFIRSSNLFGQYLNSQAEFIFIVLSIVGILSIIPAYFSWK
jgi:hypothetical protein